MSHSIVLASASAARSRILTGAGIPHMTAPMVLNEQAVRDAMADRSGEAIALELAKRKALAGSGQHPGSWVIGCDQVLDCEGVFFSRPASILAARSQLEFLRGKTHGLCSAVCVAHQQDEAWCHVETPRLTMREFTDGFLDSYIATAGEGLYSPGAYHLEGLGAALFDKVEGDYFAILGLPLLPLLEWLRKQRAISV